MHYGILNTLARKKEIQGKKARLLARPKVLLPQVIVLQRLLRLTRDHYCPSTNASTGYGCILFLIGCLWLLLPYLGGWGGYPADFEKVIH